MKIYGYLQLTVITVIVLFSEALIAIIENLLNINNLSYYNIIHWATTCIIWFVCILIIFKCINKRSTLFGTPFKPELKKIIISIIMISISIISSSISWGAFKPVAEYNTALNHFSYPVLSFIMQYIYYILEGVLISFIVIFSQEFFEKLTKIKYIPWGGIICCVTWGIGHILSKDLVTGIYATTISLLFGISYLILGKNTKYTIPVIIAMFIL